ncbi:MAG: carboxypeptidase regulatory-like domain-containing protein [Candidatus Hydrogenedentes bacterium]|nr:carboxypeptidase regulatory-like domain-containing protein [Candidatus Hydrogenedentota bacterium]
MRYLPALCILVLSGLASLGASTPVFVVNGVVNDPTGPPAAGTAVWLSQDRIVHKAATDTKGVFVFTSVAPGAIEIVAYKKGAALDGLDARVVGDSTVQLTLREPDVLPVKVLNQAHEPLPGARVKSMFVGGRFHVSVEDLVDLGFPSVRSDDKGMLLVGDLPRGSNVSVTVAHRDFAENRFPPVPVTAKALPIILYPGVRLRGQVTTPDKKPAIRARVSVFRVGAQGQREFAEGVTDPEGFFNVTVRAGEYLVAAHHTDFASPDPKPVTLVDKDENTLDIQMQPIRTVRGTVLTPDGKPAAAVEVAYIMNGGIRDQAMTIRDGAFLLRVPPGEGRVHVLPPDGYIPENPVDTTLKLEKEAEVALPPIKLKALPEITGTALNAEGQPEPGALVSSVDLDPPQWTRTGADGGFRIQLPRVPFEHTASFRVENGRRFQRGEFKVSFDELTPAKVQMKEFDPDTSAARRDRIVNNLDALVGKAAPEWACRAWFNTDGIMLKDLRGKVVVLTLWGGFDTLGPGKNRITELNTLYDVFQGVDDVVFVGIHDGGSDASEVKSYVERSGIRYPVGLDSEPFVTFGLYQTASIPQSVLIDKKGVVRHYEMDGRLLELIKALRRDG